MEQGDIYIGLAILVIIIGILVGFRLLRRFILALREYLKGLS